MRRGSIDVVRRRPRLRAPSRPRRELLEPAVEIDRTTSLERTQDLPLGESFDDRVAEPEGAQKTGVGGQKDLLHPEQLGHPAGVLAAGATEGHQRVTGGIDALAHRDVADGLRHAFVGDPQQTLEDLLVAARPATGSLELAAELVEPSLRRLEVDGNRESLGNQPAEEQIDIGQGQRSAGAVARRARDRAGALRSDRQPPLLHPADRAATGGHRLDGEGRHGQLHRSDLVREDVLEVAVEAGHIGAGAAHVEGDHPVPAASMPGQRRADDSAGRTAE